MSRHKEQPDGWRNLSVEDRQQFYQRLLRENSGIIDRPLSRLELANACGIVPDESQKDLLESDAQQIILNCTRQWGKSTISSLLALHQTCYVEDSLTLVLAPSSRQSSETYRKVREAYYHLDGVPKVVNESSLKLELANGSRVQVLPGKEATVRGFSDPALIIVDEAARVPDDLYQSVRPMLAVSGGRLVLMSTPFGSRGFFWKEWTEGGDDWKRVKVTGWQCPRISDEWLKKEKDRIGAWWFSQEYECTFVDSMDACFSTADIMAAISSEVKPLWIR